MSIAINNVESAPFRDAGVTNRGGLAKFPSGESSIAISTISRPGLDKSAGSYQQFLICWRKVPAKLPCSLEPEPRALVEAPADLDNCGARLPPAFTPLALLVAAAISNIGDVCPCAFGAGLAGAGVGARCADFGVGLGVGFAIGGGGCLGVGCLATAFAIGGAAFGRVFGGGGFEIGGSTALTGGGGIFGRALGGGGATTSRGKSSVFAGSCVGSLTSVISFATSAISVSCPIVLATSAIISTEIAGSGLVIGVTFQV